MSSIFLNCQRPQKLYRYSERHWLERSLKLGEFRFRPASDYSVMEGDLARQDNEMVRIRTIDASQVKIVTERGQEIKTIEEIQHRRETATNYLILCLSSRWDPVMFDDFSGSDSCLVIHEPENFCERLHAAAEIKLHGWSGIDLGVEYGTLSPMGVAFSKPEQFASQAEWRFAYGPPQAMKVLNPIVISMGSIEGIAEIVQRPSKASLT
jgi:hypothetical protein